MTTQATTIEEAGAPSALPRLGIIGSLLTTVSTKTPADIEGLAQYCSTYLDADTLLAVLQLQPTDDHGRQVQHGLAMVILRHPGMFDSTPELAETALQLINIPAA